MRILQRAALACALLLLPIATAQAFLSGEPPAEFNYRPSGGVRVVHHSFHSIAGPCRQLADGCAMGARTGYGRGVCTVHVRRVGQPAMYGGGVMTPEHQAKVIRHEQAHCNGWRH
jgi:hypothetical protein